MTASTKTPLIASLEQAAQQAGLALLSTAAGTDFNGAPTTIFQIGLSGAADHALQLELSDSFAFSKPELLPQLTTHLAAQAKRLRNPRPDCSVTLAGLPIAFGKFQWPCHRSTSGADTYIVHGEMHLADGGTHNLHAKVAAAITVTFGEIVPAMEQPYAEAFVYNAIRKTVDLGQLEFLKSGNRQPVPVTTRFYSRWKKAFTFTDTTAEEQLDFILRKVYWLSGVLGGNQPVWIADPRDAQYLNTTSQDLLRVAREAGTGLITFDDEFAAPTPKLLALAPKYQADLEAALSFTKPQFNESMRAGQANM
ncbi:MAG: hypothetical protein P4L40_13975 [Terracidiphilus sp.]|nr:hypothetical protein [Terracidiphilus sp.]